MQEHVHVFPALLHGFFLRAFGHHLLGQFGEERRVALGVAQELIQKGLVVVTTEKLFQVFEMNFESLGIAIDDILLDEGLTN